MPSRIPDSTKSTEPQYGGNHKLIGKNYTTPDLIAKVTGRSKYAEDYRAEGMLFCKLLLSPVPHGRVKHLDLSAALAMPGVKGILTEDDLPAPADSLTDNGTVIKANKLGERGLTNEPLYQGEPILAVAAVDELTAAEAIEKIKIEFERLPFAIDPLETLRPGGPNARVGGNTWYRPPALPQKPGERPAAPPPIEVREVKWTEADFAEAKEGRMPMGHVPDDPASSWSYGDLEAGFKNAALVLDETFVTPDTSHQCLEPRTTMSYWQNGKVYVFTGTQSMIQTVPAIARWMNMDPSNVVLVSEYTGGGFGSKGTAAISLIIPALLSKKCNAPVMMRITREEEHFIGRARPSLTGRMKVGFSKDGRILAVDMFSIINNGPYDAVGDAPTSGRIVSLLYQPQAMRFRGLTMLTNTPPRGAQSAPGGMQGITLMEPILAKAGRKLGVDQIAIRRINAPEGKAPFGPVNRQGKRAYATSSFIKQALDQGAEKFNWNERVARNPKRIGTKVRGVGVSMSCYSGGSVGFDGLTLIKPDGRICFQSGIGNLGTESVIDVHRVTAEILGVPWDKCDVCWGSNTKNVAWSCVSGGSQTTHAMTRAAHAVAMEAKRRLQEIAAKSLGGKPEDYEVANERVFHKGGGAGMTLAQAAQKAIQLGGIYDGHETNPDVNRYTKASAKALAGQGLVVSARDTYPRDGNTYSYVATFAEVEVDVETGKYHLVDFLAYADVGSVLHPRALGGQVMGRSILGIGHAIGQKWVMDPEQGAMLSRRFHHSKPPTILDIPAKMEWAALDIPDPETPVGSRGIGEPPVGGGCSAILNALADAVGDEVFRRAPVNADTILASLEAGHPTQHPLMAHI
ncbi:MAG TPA: xanthine dehydrogenase family protein molybdopterin-binding subunit [Bryobacteraceae bacterium]|nr:xanthine dehydrogenase family protein molybdopterin-binding subunit [Bryobacteraceae bacterium]